MVKCKSGVASWRRFPDLHKGGLLVLWVLGLALLLAGGVGLTLSADPPLLPATYYGPVLAGGTFSPTVGMTVTAVISGSVCGVTPTITDAGAVLYGIQVSQNMLCGASGRRVSFVVAGQVMTPTVLWNDARAWYVPLRPLTAPLAVQANFTATPTSGGAPLTVNFTNLSTGDFDYQLWDFGEGPTSTLLLLQHTYHTPGTYTVALTVAGLGGTATRVRPGYISVYAPVVRVYLPLIVR